MLSDGVALDTDVVASTYVHIAMWPPQTFLGCQVMSDALARCRERVAKTGAGACVTEAKMHALCRQTQVHPSHALYPHTLSKLPFAPINNGDPPPPLANH